MMAKPIRAVTLHYPMIQVQFRVVISHLKCYIYTPTGQSLPMEAILRSVHNDAAGVKQKQN